jgi:hepatocyte growth factor-regulated tyrosine kinase substrate
LRRIAEEQERQRQMQMAYKLEIMRKKKQEYLQYQRQLALQRIQEQEREMQIRQEQQKAQYMMGGSYPYQPNAQGSPLHHPSQFNQYGYQQPGPDMQPNQHGAFIPINPAQNMMHVPPGAQMPRKLIIILKSTIQLNFYFRWYST